ncbi:MAG: hypothetical protein AB1921_06395, partial [Thermodesulfobacteriota bacterium]
FQAALRPARTDPGGEIFGIAHFWASLPAGPTFFSMGYREANVRIKRKAFCGAAVKTPFEKAEFSPSTVPPFMQNFPIRLDGSPFQAHPLRFSSRKKSICPKEREFQPDP